MVQLQLHHPSSAQPGGWWEQMLSAAAQAPPPLIAAVGIGLLLVLLLLLLARRRQTAANHPRRGLRGLRQMPAPPGELPLLGHLLPVLRHGTAQAHELFLRWHEAHGPLLRVRLLHRTLVLIADPATAAQVLARGPSECTRRTPEYTTFDVAHGMRGYHAILTEQDEARWKAVRRGLAPAFGPAAIRDAFPSIVSCYAAMCARIASGAALRPQPTPKPARRQQHAPPAPPPPAAAAAAAPAAAVCIDEEIFAATVAVMAEGMLGMHLPTLQAQCDLVALACDVASLVAITNTFVSQPWKQWGYLACPALCQESRAFHRQRNAVMALTARMAAHVEGCRQQLLPRDPDHPGLAACLARLQEPRTQRPFSRQALQAELFLETVGLEAIPWTAAWTLYLLTQHPEAEARMLAELAAAGLPCDGDVAAAAAALSLELVSSGRALPYCSAVLREAMRMFPAGVGASPRMTHKPTEVGEYLVPPGVIVFPCMHSVLMYSGNWEAPREFRPERWLGTQADPGAGQTTAAAAAAQQQQQPDAFMPFSVGPKACIAQALAYVQLRVLLALLVSCFSWRLAEPCMGGPAGVMAATVAALELRVEQGMWLVPRQRQPGATLSAESE